MSSVIRPLKQAFRRAQAWGEKLQAMAQVARQVAAEYCRPYQRQIGQLRDANIRPLDRTDEMRFTVIGVLITPPEESALGYRPPLEWVAVMCRRFDLASAILSAERPQLLRWSKRVVSAQDLDDLSPEVYLTLCEEVLPSIGRRAGDLTYPEGTEKLKGWMSDWYLATAIKHNVLRRFEQQRTWRRRETTLDEARVTAGIEELAQRAAAIDRMVARDAVEEYLRQSKRPELDRAIMDALGEGRSMRSLAAELGVPERTLQQRRKSLVEFCARRLGFDEEAGATK